MKDAQAKVREFMKLAGQETPSGPTMGGKELREFRAKIFREELDEYLAAETLVDKADAIGDMLYVALGTANAHGVEVEFAEGLNLTKRNPWLCLLFIKELVDHYEVAHTNYSLKTAIQESVTWVYAFAVAHGIDIEPIFNEIHRSNMSKFIDGYRRADGKWMKGPSYTPPNLGPLLEGMA